ncbi:hypothetical protein D3C80_1347900 [compost metagenome]
MLGDHARLTNGGAVSEVHVEDLVHVVERHDHFAIGRYRCGGKAGATAGRHQRDLVFVGPQDNGLDLLGGLGEHDGGRGRGEMLGPILSVSIQGVGIGQHLARLNQGLQLINQGRIGHRQNSRTIHGHPENASRRRNECLAGCIC